MNNARHLLRLISSVRSVWRQATQQARAFVPVAVAASPSDSLSRVWALPPVFPIQKV